MTKDYERCVTKYGAKEWYRDCLVSDYSDCTLCGKSNCLCFCFSDSQDIGYEAICETCVLRIRKVLKKWKKARAQWRELDEKPRDERN